MTNRRQFDWLIKGGTMRLSACGSTIRRRI